MFSTKSSRYVDQLSRLGIFGLLTDLSTQNGIQELFETFFEGQENRLRILSALQARGLPVDVSFASLVFFLFTILLLLAHTLVCVQCCYYQHTQTLF